MDKIFQISDKLTVYDRKAFLSYLRQNHMTKEKFIVDNFKRVDLYSKEPIVYKNEEQYFNTDFNSRENLIDYFLKCSSPEQFCIDFFNKRKLRKNLVYIPSYLELKTYIAPSIKLIEKRGLKFNNVLEKLDLKKRFDYSIKKLDSDQGELTIIKDTREQNSLNFSVSTVKAKLDFGDYACLSPLYFGVHIERKSLSDFIGTLSSKNIDRFKQEIERAKLLNSYLIVIIEAKLSDALRFNDLSYIHARVSSDYIFHNLREIMEQNNHVQFLFTGNRAESSRIIEKIFRAKNQVKDVDLQYMFDGGVL